MIMCKSPVRNGEKTLVLFYIFNLQWGKEGTIRTNYLFKDFSVPTKRKGHFILLAECLWFE